MARRRRWPTWPTSRSRPPRSGGWSSCACRQPSWRSGADLAAGRHGEVIGELEALVAEDPLREQLHAQRMLALYRSGRQAEALQAYREVRELLVEQIGVEPGPELRRLHAAILRQDSELEPPAAEPSGLPPELDARTPLAGREADLDWLREHWRQAHGGAGRVVLVTGARGIGKTRLVAELAGELHAQGIRVVYVGGAAPDVAAALGAGTPRDRTGAGCLRRAGPGVRRDRERRRRRWPAALENARCSWCWPTGTTRRRLRSVGWRASSRVRARSVWRWARSRRTACGRSPSCTRGSGPPPRLSSGC